MRVADYVIEFLHGLGVDTVFTVSGGGAIFLCDALATSTKVQYVTCHHEQAVTIAAEAYARVRGGLGAAIVTTGPGGTNAITGVAGAWIDSVPQIVISGQVFLQQTIGDTGLRQLGVQELNIVDLVRPVTKYAVLVTDAADIRYHLEKAAHLATTGRPGPVWIDIPANIQNARVDPETLRGYEPEPVFRADELSLQAAAREVAAALREAKRPLFHIGQGLRLAGAHERFLALADKYRIPFVTARNANDLCSSDHPLFVGRPGTFGQRAANFALQSADVYVAIGTRLSLPQTGYASHDFARKARRFMVDIDRAELEKSTLSLERGVQADAGQFLDALEEALSAGGALQTDTWLSSCAELRRRFPWVGDAERQATSFVNSYHCVDLLSDLLAPEDVIVTDMGVSFQGTHQALRVKSGQRFFTNSGFAAMGWGLPAAVGACIGKAGARTICLSGDGGLQMNVQELATIAHHKLPVKVLLLNNGGYLTIRQTQEQNFEGRLMGCNTATGLSFPNHEWLARAYGLAFERASNHDELEDVLRRTLSGPGPALCEIMMDPEQEQRPMVRPHKRADGTATYRLEDMAPFLDESVLADSLRHD